MSSLPIKITIVAGHSIAVPTLNILLAQGQLNGVILPPQVDMFSAQLENWLGQQNIPYLRVQPDSQIALEELLSHWETDVVLNFGFMNSLQYFSQANDIKLFDISLDRSSYLAVKKCCRNIRLLVQERRHARQVTLAAFDIHSNETAQGLLNRITSQSINVIEEFLERLQHDVPEHFEPLTFISDDVFQSPLEQELLVDWQVDNSETISAMARAGNPHFGGCTVVIANSPVHLLEAHPVNHPTYGVQPGTICHVGDPEGVIVATIDGALRIEVLSTVDGIYGSLSFCEQFKIDAGMAFETKRLEQITV
ncbi:hypothetical protein [uncultured Photobacterium sp.]|uniref:hypothetical protein n=1 Tax=uncultured Photobacterium sp. TaxID=173973 RepID=UPI0026129CA5|nr:hypothetical protein [uncultured Photobacterium sp.]